MTRSRSRRAAIALSAALSGLTALSLVGCTDVGDNTAAPGDDSGIDATGIDATQPGSDQSDSSESTDGAAATSPDAGGSGPEGNEAGGGAESDAEGEETSVPDAGSTVPEAGAPTTDAGNEAGSSTPDAGVDAGGPPPDAGTDAGSSTKDAGVDAGNTNPPDAGHGIADSGVDATVDAGGGGPADGAADVGPRSPEASVDAHVEASSVGGTCVPACPASDAVNCSQGVTTGLGGTACNETEQALFNHDQGTATAGDCLRCALNGGCLHDQQSDPGPDCDELSGTVPSSAAAGAGTSVKDDCVSLLTCELQSKCGLNDPLDCYCGVSVDSNTCKTTQTGACKAEMQVGLESTDPVFISNNLTTLGATLADDTGGAVANKILTCLHNSCPTVCF